MTIDSSGAVRAPAAAPAQAFLGWRMVGVAFLAQVLANGVTLAAFGNFVKPLTDAFEVSRGTISLGVPLAIAFMGLLGPVVGRLIDHGHVRRLMTGGALLAGTGLIAMSRVESLWALALFYGGAVASGVALFGAMPSMALAANWFVRRRGLAIGIVFAGATVVSLIGPFSAQWLIDWGGWRTAMSTFGAVLIVVGAPIFAMLTIGRPEEVGQLPDGEPPSDEPVVLTARLRSAGDLARDARLWLVSIGFGLIFTSPVVLVQLVIPFATDLGFAEQKANLFFAMTMPFSLIGKVVIGSLADRAPLAPMIGLVVVMNVLVWLLFLSAPGFPLYLAAGVLYGIGIGGAAPLQGVVIGRCFGRVNFGTASGLGGLPAILLLVLASTLSSLLQGDGEGYPTIFVTQAALVALGGGLLAFVRIPSAGEEPD